MKITLEKIRSEKKVSGCYNSVEILKNAGYPADKPLEICYDAVIEQDNVIIGFKIKGIVKFQCDRCLKDVYHEIAVKNTSAVSLPDFGEEYDLDEEVRQLAALAAPVKIVCEDYCKGLCPVCGINLNDENCACGIKMIDPRFEKLKNFKF